MTTANKMISPMGRGNGAFVIHKLLENQIKGYHVHEYAPRWEYFPFAFPFFFRNEHPALIHTTPDHGFLFQRRNIPLVITFHNLVLDAFMKKYSTWKQHIHYKTDLRLFTHLSLKSADAVTAVSAFTANMARVELGYQGPIRIIYNGIDTKTFSPVTHSRHGKRVRVLFAGNLTLRKGAHLLPEIAKKLSPNIEIVYTCGLRGGFALPDRPNLKKLGKIAYTDMAELYRSCDILLFPSVREGFGLVPAEAMSCECPVVATDCSSLPELIDDGKGGFLCPTGDADAFADKINILAASPQLRREMGAYNRAKVEKMFTLERMIEEYQQLFEEVLSRNHYRRDS